MHKFEIQIGETSADTEIKMDGKPLVGVRQIEFFIDVGGSPFFKLELTGVGIFSGDFSEEEIIKVQRTRHLRMGDKPFFGHERGI